jgi:hypothetical protein
MFLKTSRYLTVPAFEPDPDGRADFRGIRPRPIPPTAGVIEHRLDRDDRPDRLAGEYYAANRAWWRIMDANPDFLIAGPLLGADGAQVSGGDGVVPPVPPDEGTGDVMISDKTEGDAVLVPKRSG